MDEIKQFKTTLLARRFPGLRDLKDEDIRNLITADSKAAGRALTDPRSNKTRPNTDYFIPAPKRDTIEPSTQAPFSPINPYMAKDEITRTAEESYLSLSEPYGHDTEAYLADKHADEAMRLATWHPPRATKAKQALIVDVYLMSPTAGTKAAERETIRSRTTSNTQQLKELARSRRGQMLV